MRNWKVMLGPLLTKLLERAHIVRKHPLFFPALLGICIRLVLLPYTNWPHDYHWFYGGATDMLAGRDPYASYVYIYPPLFAYAFFPFVYFFASIFGPTSLAQVVPSLDEVGAVTGMVTPIVTSPFFNIAVKAPIFLADLGVGLLLLSLLKKAGREEMGRMAFMAWFLNPYVIMTNALLGQFDAIPAFLTLLAVILVLEFRNFYAGMSIGLAAMFKAYPTFLGIALLGLILGLNFRSRNRQETIQGLKSLVIYGAGIVLIAVMFLLPLYFSNGLELTFRWASGFNVGGFTFWSLSFLEPLSWLKPTLIRLQPGLQVALLSAGVAASLFFAAVAWKLLRDKANSVVRIAVGLAIVTIGAVYLLLTNINPQYLTWVYPYLILAVAMSSRSRRLIVGTAIAAIGYYISLQGPLAFFYPLATSTQVLDISLISDSILSYWSMGNPPGSLVRTLLFVFGFSGFLFILGIVIFGVGLLRSGSPHEGRIPREAPRKQIPFRRESRKMSPILILAVSGILLLVQVVVYATPSPEEDVSFEIRKVVLEDGQDETARWRINYSISSGGAPLVLRVVAAPLSTLDVFRPLYFYYDAEHPVVAVNHGGLRDFASHIAARLTLQGYPLEMQVVSSEELRDILVSSCRCVVIIASTVLPDTVFSSETNLITPFLESGGVLIWVGDLIGGYVASRGQMFISWEDPANPQWEGEKMIFGHSIIGGHSEFPEATISTLSAKALDLQFQSIRTGALLDELLVLKGRAIGYVEEGTESRSSISIIPIGQGKVVLFGHHVKSMSVALPFPIVARDIAQILASGLIFSVSPPVFAEHEMTARSTLVRDLVLPIEGGAETPRGILVYAYSPEASLIFYHAKAYAVG